MLIFRDVFTNDELCSDLFPHELVDDLIWEFKGRLTVESAGSVPLTGANPSAVEDSDDEGVDIGVEREIEFVLRHRLTEDKRYENISTFKSYITRYLKRVIEHLEGNGCTETEVSEFKNKIQGWLRGLLQKDRFNNLQFFVGEEMAEGFEGGQVCIVERRGKGRDEFLYLMLIKNGLLEEKL